MPVLNSLLRQQDKIPQQNRLGLMGDMRQQINSLMQHRPAKGMPTLGEVTEFGVQASPFVGDALALEQAGKDFKQGNYGSATFNAATALPVIGDAATAAKVALPALTSLGSLGAMMRMGRGTPPVTPFSKMQGVIGGSASPPKSKNADDLDIERVIKRGGTGSGFSDIEVTRVNGVADVSVEQSGNIRLTNPEKSTQWAEYSPGGELVRHGQDFTTRPDEGVLSVWNETAPKIALRIKRNSTKIPGGDVYVRYGRPPKSGKSRNHVTGEYERGVSVYSAEVDPLTGGVIFSAQGTEPGAMLNYTLSGKKPYLVSGEIIGFGSDGEPLLRSPKILGELNYNKDLSSFVLGDP